MHTATSTDVKNHFGEYLEQAREEPVLVSRTGRPVAVLMSWKDYERLSALEDSYWGLKAQQAEKSGFIDPAKSRAFLETKE
jgi:prevent-host-death family protein